MGFFNRPVGNIKSQNALRDRRQVDELGHACGILGRKTEALAATCLDPTAAAALTAAAESLGEAFKAYKEAALACKKAETERGNKRAEEPVKVQTGVADLSGSDVTWQRPT